MNEIEFRQLCRQALRILARNVLGYRSTTPTVRRPSYYSIRDIPVVMDKAKTPNECTIARGV